MMRSVPCRTVLYCAWGLTCGIACDYYCNQIVLGFYLGFAEDSGYVKECVMLIVEKNNPVPLYRQVYAHFRGQIVSGAMAPGTCLPSIRDLQRDLGVARESVKRAMAMLDSEGYIQRIQGKGTFVAPRMEKKRFWGIVVPFYGDFYNRLILQLRQVAHAEGIEIEHACDYDDWKRQVEIVNHLMWRRAEAVIVVPTRDESSSIDQFRKIARRIPLMLFDRTSIASQFPYVVQDYILGVRLAIERMVASGARRIAYLRDPMWSGTNPIYQSMEEAFKTVLSDAGLDFIRFYESAYSLPPKELESPDYDGLFCANDQVACIIAGLLREKGVDVPGQVQIVGYNDSEVGRFFTPRITTVAPDFQEMCRYLLDIIGRFKSGEQVENLQYVMIPKVLEGGTTRPL